LFHHQHEYALIYGPHVGIFVFFSLKDNGKLTRGPKWECGERNNCLFLAHGAYMKELVLKFARMTG
jgi:hypothetical protein